MTEALLYVCWQKGKVLSENYLYVDQRNEHLYREMIIVG